MLLRSPLFCAASLALGSLATASTVDSSLERIQQVEECLKTASQEIAMASRRVASDEIGPLSLSGDPEEAPNSLEANLTSALEHFFTAHFVAIEMTTTAPLGVRSQLYHCLTNCRLVMDEGGHLVSDSTSTQPQIVSLVSRIIFVLSELKKLISVFEEPSPRALCPAAAKIQIAILRFISPMIGINSILDTPHLDVMLGLSAPHDPEVAGLRARLLATLISEAQERLAGLGREQRESIDALKSHRCSASHSFGYLARTFSLIPLHVQSLSVICKRHALNVLQQTSGALSVDLCSLAVDAALEYFNMRPITSLSGGKALIPEGKSKDFSEKHGERVAEILRDSEMMQDLDTQCFPVGGKTRAWYNTAVRRGVLAPRKDFDGQIVDWFDGHFNIWLRTVEKPVVQLVSLVASLDRSFSPRFFAAYGILSERMISVYARLLNGRRALYQCTQLSTIHDTGNLGRLIILLFNSAPLFNLIEQLESIFETCFSQCQSPSGELVLDSEDLLTILNLSKYSTL